MAGGSSTKVIQVTNIAPQATKDQLTALFSILGKIDDLRLYPTIRDVSVPVISRICYVKFFESGAVLSAQHMTNTVFIDRALICIPVANGSIPDEYHALEMAANGTLVPGIGSAQIDTKLPTEVVSRVEGQMPNQVIRTYDPKLEKYNLPDYPALPVNFDDRKIEETRRTILVLNVESDWRLDDLIDYFKRAGEVKYARFAETDRQRIAMIEFCEQKSIIYALKMQGSNFNNCSLNLYHSTQPIIKPEAKSNEAAQKEIEEAMSIVKECHNQISAVIDPAFGILPSKEPQKTSVSRTSRSRSRSRVSHSRSRRSRSRKRSTSRRRKRSTSRRRSRSRSRSHSRRRKRSTSRRRRSRSRSRDRRRRREKRSRDRSRSRHRRSNRSRSRERDRRSRSKSRHRSDRKKRSHREKRDERKYSVSRSKSKSPARHSPVREKVSSKISKRSPERKLRKLSEARDYDVDEKIGTDDNICEKSSSKSDNMDISP